MQKEAMRRIREAALGKPQLCEWHAKRKDGKLIWVEVNLKSGVIRDRKCVLAVVRDITERKKAEKALRDGEERFSQIAENAVEWIWEVDDNGLYTYASPIGEKILGYKPEEIVGKKHFYDLFHPEGKEETKK